MTHAHSLNARVNLHPLFLNSRVNLSSHPLNGCMNLSPHPLIGRVNLSPLTWNGCVKCSSHLLNTWCLPPGACAHVAAAWATRWRHVLGSQAPTKATSCLPSLATPRCPMPCAWTTTRRCAGCGVACGVFRARGGWAGGCGGQRRGVEWACAVSDRLSHPNSTPLSSSRPRSCVGAAYPFSPCRSLQTLKPKI
eukprot:359141-Chlamydomonas_euryale.AAC.2